MRTSRWFIFCGFWALLAGCAGFGGPRTYTLSEADLQRAVERHFPLERRVFEVIDLNVGTPRLQLLAGRNRLATVLDVDARDRLFGGSWHGRLALASALRYEPSDQSVRLVQVRVDSFTLDTAGTPVSPEAGRVGALLAEKVLEDMVLYRLSPERLAELRGHGLQPSAVTVTARGVEVTLVPATAAPQGTIPPPL